jgi:hypothetical protein
VWLAAFATLLVSSPTPAEPPPTAHHPGAWTAAQYWPGTGTTGVQAVHMALLRGDTLFGVPHSQVIAWGSWSADIEEGFPDNGGRWAWNPTSDACANAPGNLTKLLLDRPAFNPFCAGMGTTPTGDLVILNGHERTICGEPWSLRLDRESGQWGAPKPMADRRWYSNGVMLPEAAGRLAVFGGYKYDTDVTFAGRRGDGTLTNDVQRYTLTDAGG